MNKLPIIENTKFVVDSCIKQVSDFPRPFCDQGNEYLKKCGYYSGKYHNGICTTLPFMINDAFNLDLDTCRKISLGSTYILLYFYVQDEIMDTKPGEYKGDILPLGNLFYQEFMSIFRSLLPSNSEFWTLVKKYIEEWAFSVYWERKEHWGQANDYSEEDLILLARKAAPLKIPCIAMSFLTNKEDTIPSLEKMVDYSQVAFQFIDDWKDWKKDLIDGNYSYLLTEVMNYCKYDDISKLTQGSVQEAIYAGGILDDIFSIAEKYCHLTMESVNMLDVPHFNEYFFGVLKSCINIRRKAEEKRKKLMWSLEFLNIYRSDDCLS